MNTVQYHLLSVKKYTYAALLLFPVLIFIYACYTPEKKSPGKKADYIKKIEGKNDTLPQQIIERGKVLIAYSDCFNCHAEERRSKGPAFLDIAKRYPIDSIYINMLAHRIINGGSGAWGGAVMDPHPKLPLEHAKIMVSYILSLEQP